MRIGCVKEIMKLESRVGLTPSSVKEYVNHKHEVFIEKGAGLNSGFSDQDYLDQGGSTEVSKATYHDDPTFVVDGIVHYCVANMPGAVPRTSTIALNNSTLRYGLMIADLGLEAAIKESKPLKYGVNTFEGKCTCQGVADAFNLEYIEL